MAYTKEQIKEYTEIFLKYKKQLEEPLLKEKKFIQPVLTLIVLQTSRNPISRGVLEGCNPPTPNFILNQVFTCVNHVIRLMVMHLVIMI